jgi:hypothetical protein
MFLNIFIYVLEKSKVFKGTQNPTSESSDNRTCASWHSRASKVSAHPQKKLWVKPLILFCNAKLFFLNKKHSLSSSNLTDNSKNLVANVLIFD